MSDDARDPVCGMTVDAETALSVVHGGRAYYFDSEYCRDAFLREPERYVATEPPGPGTGTDAPTRRIAYFSMEVAIDPRLPTYSGGLGVLAGDTLRSAADLRVPVVGVTLLYSKGYFRQELDDEGQQAEQPVSWDPSQALRRLEPTVPVTIEGRVIHVCAWQYDIVGHSGFQVPLIFLATNLPENEARDRELTAFLYGGDERYRLAQEVVLGVGGVRMLAALAYRGIERYHLNEGHASLLAIELLRGETGPDILARTIDAVRRLCVFTTHTPVPAGHDQFPYDLVRSVLGEPIPLEELRMLGGRDRLNMTLLALNLSHYVNGVAKRHGVISQEMFPGYPIDSITNGVHSFTWTSDPFRALFDRHMPGWAGDPFSLRYAIQIPTAEIQAAHAAAKRGLVDEVRLRTGIQLAPEVLTIGFARRAAAYKRAGLVFSDLERLRDLSRRIGRLQFVFAGKAHPRDQPGKELIRAVFAAARGLEGDVPVAYLEDYDLGLARLLTSGVDLWLNTPLLPLEASGTSGMKAAHNGVPSLSVLDGWWIEGHLEGMTGWSIGARPAERPAGSAGADARDADDLYAKLAGTILPLFYGDPAGWAEVMRRTIAFNASFFNTHRMVQQYVTNAYV